MTKGEQLIWDLFLMVREVMPASAENTRRQHEWAAAFHAMERGDPSSSAAPAAAEDAAAEPEAETEAAPRRKR